jgi:hypothetical protein
VSVPAEHRARAVSGWLALAALLAWSACVHHGVGPMKQSHAPRWYEPRAFLFAHDVTAALLDPPALALAALGLPALLLAACAAVGTGSAMVAALAASSAIATLLFVFYGVVAPLPWQFFGWRGSLAICGVALAVGFAIAAPLLARSWLALGWPARTVAFAPFAGAALVLLRNVTGTDPSLPFSISPWPAVPVFGLEVGALSLAIAFAGTALGVAAIARMRARAQTGAIAAGACLGVALTLGLLAGGSAAGWLPFHTSFRQLLTLGALSAAGVLAAGRMRVHDAAQLGARARFLAVAAALVGIPILAGQAWAWSDYHRTREIRARAIIDALHAYIEREGLYPDDLDELVKSGGLERIPEPAIGFRWLPDESFRYESYGTSYLLEFSAPRWVQCHYTPAPIAEDLDPEERAELAESGGLEESWSCPSKPPELW